MTITYMHKIIREITGQRIYQSAIKRGNAENRKKYTSKVERIRQKTIPERNRKRKIHKKTCKINF